VNWNPVTAESECSQCESKWKWIQEFETRIVINIDGSWTCWDCAIEAATTIRRMT